MQLKTCLFFFSSTFRQPQSSCRHRWLVAFCRELHLYVGSLVFVYLVFRVFSSLFHISFSTTIKKPPSKNTILLATKSPRDAKILPYLPYLSQVHSKFSSSCCLKFQCTIVHCILIPYIQYFKYNQLKYKFLSIFLHKRSPKPSKNTSFLVQN